MCVFAAINRYRIARKQQAQKSFLIELFTNLIYDHFMTVIGIHLSDDIVLSLDQRCQPQTTHPHMAFAVTDNRSFMSLVI